MLTWELVGAVVGAGLASGREIAAFFARYGIWSYGGILLAVGTLVALARTDIPVAWHGRWPAKLWQGMLALLLIATGGAMLSGAGEIAALTLPIHPAYWIGMAGTLILAWFLANRTDSGLAWVSRCMLFVLAVMIGLGFLQPPRQAVQLETFHIPEMLGRAMSYGGFNAALQAPIMNRTICPLKRKVCASWQAGVILGGLLFLGNAALQRHPALLAEPMPFLQMMHGYGKFGYAVGALALYLAILSTLTACLRGLGGSIPSLAGIVGVSLLGFTGVVEMAYPMLGAGCLFLLVTAKFMNCAASPFHSEGNVI